VKQAKESQSERKALRTSTVRGRTGDWRKSAYEAPVEEASAGIRCGMRCQNHVGARKPQQLIFLKVEMIMDGELDLVAGCQRKDLRGGPVVCPQGHWTDTKYVVKNQRW